MRFRRRLTYSNVAATIALLVALGGGTAVAVSRINAASVDGISAARIDFRKPVTVGPNPKFETVMHKAGLALRARCGDQSGFFMDAVVKSRVNNAEFQATMTDNTNNTSHTFSRDFDKGDTVNLPIGTADQGEGTLVFSTPRGAHLTATLQADTGLTLGGTKACLLGGTALFTPAR